MIPNINLCLLAFIANLEKNLKLNKSNINSIIIKCKISDAPEINSNKCHALVHNLNGTIYQCTRQKKFGCFCGLHHNRKNDFKTITQNKSYKEFIYKIDIAKMIKKKTNYNNNLYKVYHNYNEYYIESSTGTIYINEYNDLYNKTLIPIDNINNSTLPFTLA
jgi:hypothetical protein